MPRVNEPPMQWRYLRRWRSGPASRPILAAVMGGILGPLLLHPATMIVAWVEFHPGPRSMRGIWQFLWYGASEGNPGPMLAMTAAFVVLGAVYGFLFGALGERMARQESRLDGLERELTRSLPALLQAGENEVSEFKASARWDYREGRIAHAMEDAVIRTLAGFANHRGGSLILGVDDDGSVIGLAKDTLRFGARTAMASSNF